MWTVIHMVEGINEANKIKQELTGEGFLVKIKSTSNKDENTLYEVLVPEFEATEAHSVLIDIGY